MATSAEQDIDTINKLIKHLEDEFVKRIEIVALDDTNANVNQH